MKEVLICLFKIAVGTGVSLIVWLAIDSLGYGFEISRAVLFMMVAFATANFIDWLFDQKKENKTEVE